MEEHSRQLKLFDEKLRDVEKLMIMGMLASEMAHEVGTPLNIISGRVELLAEREKSNSKVQKDVAVINQQIERITRIIRERLDLTRKRSGQLEDIRLSQLLSSLVELLRVQMKKAKIEVTVDCSDGITLQGDEDQLQQLFLNLLVNAMQAIDRPGKIEIRCTLLSPGNPQFVEVKIRDTGVGIPPELLDKIFTPFFSTKKEKGGTGLGLSVVRDIVKRHRGDLSVQSEVGRGSTFRVLLPLKPILE